MCTEQDFLLTLNGQEWCVNSRVLHIPRVKTTKGKIHRARFSFDIQHLSDYTSLDRLTLVYSYHPWPFHERIFTSHMVGSNYYVHIVLGYF